jgi:hypothetical protein
VPERLAAAPAERAARRGQNCEAGVAISSKPLIFISHKHCDRAIATVVRGFITEQTSGRVPVFQSSDPSAKTPGIGRTLNAELRKALWDAGAVILVYTSPDEDWGYCMWECGVATLPDSPDTRIVLLQCGDSAPSLFDGQSRVNARDKTSVTTFVTQFMTEKKFIPQMDEALTGFNESSKQVEQAANRFYEDLQAVIPEGAAEEWPAHPYIQLQLPNASARAITECPPERRKALTREIVLSQATVTDSDKYACALFGLMEHGPDMRLQGLYDTWRAAHPDSPDAWIDSLTDQIGRAAQWQFPVIKWSGMPAVGDRRVTVPVLARVRKIPSLASHQFDVFFFPFNLLDATPVQSPMRHRADMYCRVIQAGGENEVVVLELIEELESHRYTRMPFVDPDGRLVYIAHRSILDQFIARQVRKRQAADLATLTLADMFTAEPQVREMFCKTAAFVGHQATVADAKAAMNAVPSCYDVFVTETGNPQEPVLGWLTDVKIASTEG